MSTPQEYPILWWTLQYGGLRYDNHVVDQCGLPYTCKMTLDKTKYDESPLVVFHTHHIDIHNLPPKDDARSGKKAWVINSVEAPVWHQRDEELTQLFSYRWTYWFNSDFVEHYFRIEPGSTSFINRVLRPPIQSLEQKNQLRRDGLAPIAWIVSNCDARNGRHFYVNQLLWTVNIDIYGNCLRNREWPRNAEGEEISDVELVSRYKFYLAIENSNCEDYVTEKLDRAYAAGVIPIVDGPADYSRFDATGNALIKIDDFSSPRSLGKYIQKLDQDDALYMERLRYKVPKDPLHTPSTKDLSRAFLRSWTHSGNLSEWGPDPRGAECGLCELTHDLKEGIVTLDGTKHNGIDRTCVLKKHYRPLWVMGYHWKLTLAILQLVGLVLFLLSRKTVRHWLLMAVSVVVPKTWIHRYKRVGSNPLPLASYDGE